MARYRSNRDFSGVDNTCPLIDDVIAEINNIDDDSVDKSRIVAVLEQIRKANSSLREWGNEEFDRANDAEEEKESLKSRVSELERDISHYEAQIKTLEQELENATAQL